MCWPWTRIIAKTKDAEERQKLLQEHMQTMRDNMMASKSMMGCPMMKDGMMDGDRMEMMEQMLEHQVARQVAAPLMEPIIFKEVCHD